MIFDIVVIGAGPAGLAAAAYALHYHVQALVIAPDLSGKAGHQFRVPWASPQNPISDERTVEHWNHRLTVSQHATIATDFVVELTANDGVYRIRTKNGELYLGRTVVVASGVTPQRLDVPGEQRLTGFGLSYSAISHAPLFTGRRVVVVGNTPRALEAVVDLRRLAATVTLVAPDSAALQATSLGQRVLGDTAVRVCSPATVVSLDGDTHVSNITIADAAGQREVIPTDGVFIKLGLTARSDFLGDLVERIPGGQIVVDSRGATRAAGLFAAGDITSAAYAEQLLIAMGDGARAGLSACAYLAQQ